MPPLSVVEIRHGKRATKMSRFAKKLKIVRADDDEPDRKLSRKKILWMLVFFELLIFLVELTIWLLLLQRWRGTTGRRKQTGEGG